jgi:hypothetical protein
MGFGYEQATNIGLIRLTDTGHYFDPLHDDAQAMALVKKLGLTCEKWVAEFPAREFWRVLYTVRQDVPGSGWTEKTDLNRAIVACVAKMQMAATERTATKEER